MRNPKIALLILGVYTLSLIASAITVQPVQAAVAAGYSEYFIPGSIDQLFRIIKSNDNDPDLGNAYPPASTCAFGTNECNEMHSIISVSVATDNLKLYFDHWENGYGTGSTGDEVFTADAGDVLVFESGNIRVPRAPANTCTSTNPSGSSTRCYDGRDRIYVAGGAVSVAQAFWPEAQNLDTIYSNAWEVYPVKPYQSSYTMPVGEDLADNLGYTDFTNAYLIVQATQDNTTVQIDDPALAGLQVNQVLNRGGVTDYFHFHVGTTVTASAPVQVQFIIGQPWPNTSSDSRSFTAVPDGLWASSYYSPVPSYGTTYTNLYVYNPSTAPLKINFQDRTGSGSYTLAAGETRSYRDMAGRYVPDNSGVYLAADDGVTKFWAIGSYDMQSASFNYGFTLIPPDQLTEEYFISWAPGTNDRSANGSPVFVTPVNDDTTVFVDHSPTDGIVDATYVLDRVQIAKIRDLKVGDYDNTGMHVWATGPISIVWGEDDQYAGTGNPYIDAGYTILPLKQEWLESVLTMDKSADPAAVPAEIGSISQFTLTVQGYAYGLNGVWVYDDLPYGWAYVPGSTVITLPGGATITGPAAEPAVSGQELNWANFPSAPLDMNPGEVLTIVYQAQVASAPTSGYVINESTVTGTVGDDSFTASDSTTVYMVNMEMEKVSDAGGVVNPGDTITYTVTVDNTGGSTLNDLVIIDLLPAGTTYVSQSTTVNYIIPASSWTYRDEFGTVAYNNSNGTQNWSANSWDEMGGDGGDDANGGTTLITGGWLRFDGDSDPSFVTRSVPMAGAESATFSFDYRVNGTIETGDAMSIQVSNGVPFTVLDSYDGVIASSGTYTRDITSFASAITEIRLGARGFTGGSGGSVERLEIDNVQVQYNLPAQVIQKDNIIAGSIPNLQSGIPPTLVMAGDNIDLPAGGKLTLTYQVVVDDPVADGITHIVNTAQVRSAEMLEPLESTVSDRVRGVHLTASKTAAVSTVPETGGPVSFTFTITNDGLDPVTITDLNDDRFGVLSGDADCQAGITLAAGASCSFDAVLNIPAGSPSGTHVNTFTVSASDGFGNTGGTSESETVTYTDVLPDISVLKTAGTPAVAETGGSVSYTFTVTNHATEPVTITALSDNRFGALAGDADCQVGTELAGNGSCSFSTPFILPAGEAGGTHVNTFTAAVSDNDGNKDAASEDETVTYTNVLPDITVIKTASPVSIPEVGGSVTYTFTVTNLSAEAATITSLSDDRLGVLAGDADCQKGTMLAGGASCSFIVETNLLPGNADDTHINIFTADASDNEGSSDRATDDETVTYTDVLPDISVLKTAGTATVEETGGTVIFTYTVTNNSAEEAVIGLLDDDQFGALGGDADCYKGTALASGASCSFEAIFTIPAGEAGMTHVNIFTAGVADNEENSATASEDETITYTDVLPQINVEKTAWAVDIQETGGDVTYTFTVTNDGAETVTIASLEDDAFGPLTGDADCAVGTMLPASVSCSLDVTFTLPAGTASGSHVNTFTASAEDNEGGSDTATESETVIYKDVLPEISVFKSADSTTVAETGGIVTYTFTVTNNSLEPVTITLLTDDRFGPLTGDATCQVGTVLSVGASCSFSEDLLLPAGSPGEAHENTFTAQVIDNDGSTSNDSASETVAYEDVLPQISVQKTANPLMVAETGGNVTYTFTVTNTGGEAVTITTLSDDRFGTLTGHAGCQVGTTLAAGVSCSFAAPFALPAANAGDTHINTFTASASDNDGNSDDASVDATVTYTDVLPEIIALKTASVSEITETGGSVTFTYTVTNSGTESVTINALDDDRFGTLTGDLNCQVGTILAAGASCSFDATFNLPAANAGDSHTNIFAASASDNDGNSDTASDDATVTYIDVLPEVTVSKTADRTTVPETGGSVTFTFLVENMGQEPVALTSLVDNVFGDLSGLGTCAVPQTIGVGSSYSCTITQLLSGDDLADHTNTVTATAEDNDGSIDTASDDETVTFTDVLPAVSITKTAGTASVPETGAPVTFTFLVENAGQESVTLNSLVDDVYGDLNGLGTCSVPHSILAGGSYTCTITEFLSSDTLADHTNTVTGEVSDNDGNTETGTDTETVTFIDEPPAISVLKTAESATLPETGGSVTFTYTVTNIGGEAVTITALSDDKFGVLSGVAGCQVGTTLAVGASCTFDVMFALSAAPVGSTHINVFTAEAIDNDGSSDTASDDATVTYTNVLPQISVLKTAGSATVLETGGSITFTYTVTNSGAVPVTIDTLSDDQFGMLTGDADCAVGTSLAAGASCSFESIFTIPAGEANETHVNVFTAEVTDDDGSSDSASDDETVTYTNVLPQISVLKTAGSTDVAETGGPVTFTYTVTNDGAEDVTIDSLVDDQFGALTGDADCQVGTVLATGASCSFNAVFAIPAGDAGGTHINVFTAQASDNDGSSDSASDSETVSYTDTLPAITVLKSASSSTVVETGGDITYTFSVTNAGLEVVTIAALSDDRFGVLAGDPDCEVGTVLAAGASCSFDAIFTLPAANWGDTHTNVFTAQASDNEGSSDIPTDDETVTYSDVMPEISVLKTASVNEIAETGGSVTFTYTVTNLSAEEATIFYLGDDQFGELNGDDDCQFGTILAGEASCSFDATFVIPAGESGGAHINVFTADVLDNEENLATDTDDETITYTDVLPDVSVTKTAAAVSVLETGENVTFTFTVTNNGFEPVTIVTLSDDQFGALTGDADCQVGTVLAAGAGCAFDAVLAIPAGAVGSTHVNIFTATVSDNEGSSDSASDSETVTYIDVPAPAITVIKEVFANGSWWDANTAPGPQINYGTDPQFRFTVRNTGNVILTGITLADSLYSTASCTIPASLTPNDGSDGIGTDEFSCIITAPWALGQHTNSAAVTAAYGGSIVSASDPANYLGMNFAADLAVTKTDGVTTYVPGQPLTYTITVTNNGLDPVVGAIFNDAIPAQISSWTWTCVHGGGASGCDGVTNSTTDFTDTIDLPVDGSVTYTVVATTSASAITALTNTANISTPTGTDDTDPSNNSATDTDTAAPQVNLSIVKVADALYRPNENLSYTITVTNHGPSDATDVVVSDLLPNEVTFVSATPANTGGPSPVTWDLGTLNPGDTRIIRLVVLVKDWVNLPFTNTAAVSSTTAETTVTDNSDSALTQPEAPTPVELLYFRARSTVGKDVLVEWEAETEVDHFGYKLFRTTTPVFEDAVELVFVEPNAEKLYTYTDTGLENGRYYYWLVDVSTTSAETRHGPVLVIIGGSRLYLPVIGR